MPSERYQVCPTRDRNFELEYIVQLPEWELTERFPKTQEGDFLLIRNNEPFQTEIHARVHINNEIEAGFIGLDFTLREALGVPSKLEVEHGNAATIGEVKVESFQNPEGRWRRRILNRTLGIRPQVCRVRMGVFPDLEDKICRLPPPTMELLGVEEGDNVTIESTRGPDRIVRGVKALAITDERRAKKEKQIERDEIRYPCCIDLLQLGRIRRTQVDIPEIWIDQEVRSKLGFHELEKNGVCQPVRVYRDSWDVMNRISLQLMFPLVFVLIAAGIEVQGPILTGFLWVLAVTLWLYAVRFEIRGRLF